MFIFYCFNNYNKPIRLLLCILCAMRLREHIIESILELLLLVTKNLNIYFNYYT